MQISDLLHIAVIFAALYSAIALSIIVWKSFAFGTKPIYAKPDGSATQGVFYAFFTGMLPWEKESVGMHLPTFIAGLFYHTAIFLGLVNLSLGIFHSNAQILPVRIQQFIFIVGIASGIGLLTKRLTLKKMLLISTLDDIIANLIVDFFILNALLATYSARYEPVFMANALVLFIYMPLGKIRHCIFFFYSRFFFGVFFGRRGVFPRRIGN